MPSSPPSSRACETCRPTEASAGAAGTGSFGNRIAWRPSRLLAAILVLLGVLAAAAVLVSEMPRAAAYCVAAAALLHGLRRALRERVRPPVHLAWDLPAGTVTVDGAAVTDAELSWRGPLAFLRWRDAQGGVRRLAFWPDVLDAGQRRALRLAAGPTGAAALGRRDDGSGGPAASS